jgi:hypothetical protein
MNNDFRGFPSNARSIHRARQRAFSRRHDSFRSLLSGTRNDREGWTSG